MKNTAKDHLLNTLIVALIGIGIVSRIAGIEFVSGDFEIFLSKWYAHLRQHGLDAFKDNFSNYTPFYLYLLSVPAAFGVSALLGVKAVSIVFDATLAFTVYNMLVGDGRQRARLAAAVIWCSPVVILNSSFWGQCDTIYVTFLVLAVWLIANDSKSASFLCFGIAFAAKLQSIFLLPLYLILLISGRLSLRDCIKLLAMVSGVYLLFMVPAMLSGGDFFDLLFKYLGQIGHVGQGGNEDLSFGAPFFPLVFLGWGFEAYSNPAKQLLFWISIASTLFFIAAIAAITMRRRPSEDSYRILVVAALFAVAVPFLLPKMHERYFYAADILSIILASTRPRLIWIAVLINLSSLAAYIPYLFSVQPVSMRLVSIMILAALVGLIFEWWRAMDEHQIQFSDKLKNCTFAD